MEMQDLDFTSNGDEAEQKHEGIAAFPQALSPEEMKDMSMATGILNQKQHGVWHGIGSKEIQVLAEGGMGCVTGSDLVDFKMLRMLSQPTCLDPNQKLNENPMKSGQSQNERCSGNGRSLTTLSLYQGSLDQDHGGG